MRKLIFYLSILTLEIFLIGSCKPPTFEKIESQPKANAEIDQRYLDEYVKKFIDHEAGVVCWVYTGIDLECMPLSETELKK